MFYSSKYAKVKVRNKPEYAKYAKVKAQKLTALIILTNSSQSCWVHSGRGSRFICKTESVTDPETR